MFRGLVAAVVSAFLVASLVAGCGGSDEDQLSKSEFVQQADAICARAEKEKNAALIAGLKQQGEANEALSPKIEEELVTTALPPIKAMTEELEDLGTPDEGGNAAAAIVSAFAGALEAVEADPSVAVGGKRPFAKADKLASEYGLKACSEI